MTVHSWWEAQEHCVDEAWVQIRGSFLQWLDKCWSLPTALHPPSEQKYTAGNKPEGSQSSEAENSSSHSHMTIVSLQSPHTGGRDGRINMSLRPAWSPTEFQVSLDSMVTPCLKKCFCWFIMQKSPNVQWENGETKHDKVSWFNIQLLELFLIVGKGLQ